MSATLNLKSNFSITVGGKEIVGWQGTNTANDADDAFSVVVDGKVNYQPNQLADQFARTLWDDDNATPTDFDFMFFVADKDVDFQIIGATINVVHHLLAGVPFVLSYDDIFAAANTTPLVNDTSPSYEEIDSLRINNSSGSTANYVFFCVD